MHRLVVDTKVIVSAAIRAGKPRQFLLEVLFGDKYTLVMSDEIIREIRDDRDTHHSSASCRLQYALMPFANARL